MILRFKQTFQENLRVQIFTAFTVLIFSISVAFSVLTFIHQKKALQVELEESGKLLIKPLAYSCRIGVFSENAELLQTPVAGVFQHQGVMEVSIYNSKWETILRRASQNQAVGTEGEPIPELFQQQAGSVPANGIHIEDRKDTMVFWSAVMPASDFKVQTALMDATAEQRQAPDNILGYLRITLGKSAMRAQLLMVLLRNLMIAMCFLVIGTLVTFYIANRITQPLKRLTEAVVASGEAGALSRIPVESRNEIGNLAVAFNNLSLALERRNLEKQQLEEKLWQSQKMEAIGTLAGGVAHDFNNILGVIMGFSEIALLTAPPEGKYQDYLQEVFKASGRAKELVNQILTFSRKSKTEGRPLQLGLVIKEALKMLRASLPSTIELRHRIQERLPSVLADPTQIYQVLMNLCGNAGHAMREKGGQLDVTLVAVTFDDSESLPHPEMRPGNYQKLTVCDTGHGMDRSVMERIFEPFYTTKGPGEGTGMGLAVVHGILKTHGGVILVDSTPGVGTCFDLFFPSLDTSETVAPKPQGPIPTGTERILLVDDEEPLVKVGKQILTSFGYTVTATSSSLEALKFFKDDPNQFDLIITDLTMPKMTGLALSDQILQLRENMPIILVTGFSEAIQVETARKLGIRELAIKPVVWKDLARVIRRALT